MKKGLKKSKWAVSFGSGALLLQSLLLSHSACAAADSTANTSSSSSASDKSGKRDLNAGGTEKSSTDKQGNEKSSADKPGVVGSEKSSGDKTGDLIKVRAEKADTSGAISPEKVNKLLETEDVYGEQFRVSSFIQGNDVTVQTWTNPKSKDPERDERINAVLISKKILDAFPDAVKLCKIRYFDRQDHKKYREFTVVPGVVKSFGAGILTETDLLNTLPLLMAGGDASPTSAAGTKSESSDHAGTSSANSSGAPAGTNSSGTQTSGSSSSAPKNAIASATVPGSTAAVVPVAKPVPLDPNNISSALPGIEQAKRAKLLKHILELEKKGVKSPLARQMFVTIEEQVRDGHENEARTSIQRLSSSIESMEKNYQKAKTTKPTPGPVSSRLGGSSPSGSHPVGRGAIMKPDCLSLRRKWATGILTTEQAMLIVLISAIRY